MIHQSTFVKASLCFLTGIFALTASFSALYGQQPSIRSMEWGSNLKISLELTNDSSYVLDVDQLPHSNGRYRRSPGQYTYYPARLSEDFIRRLKSIPLHLKATSGKASAGKTSASGQNPSGSELSGEPSSGNNEVSAGAPSSDTASTRNSSADSPPADGSPAAEPSDGVAAMTRDSLTRDSMAPGSMDRDSMPRDSMTHESVARDSLPRDSVPRDSLPRDSYPIDSVVSKSPSPKSNKTLWSALHQLIGGGWPHFINTMLYALEKGYLELEAPLMKRPDNRWKPDPVTESYRRTRKWDHYVPVNQRYAHREYQKRKAEGELGQIRDIPSRFISLFKETGNWKYKRLKKKGKTKKLARIDLVKLLLGSFYLGKPQIKYIKTMVLKAVNDYSKNRLPSVIIFDNFHAAVAMSLNEKGYRVDRVVFNDAGQISSSAKIERRRKIRAIVDNINQVNKKLFQERLKDHYK